MCGNQAATCIEEANSKHHGIDHSKEIETFFMNFKSMFRLRKPEKSSQTKEINKILPQFSLK